MSKKIEELKDLCNRVSDKVAECREQVMVADAHQLSDPILELGYALDSLAGVVAALLGEHKALLTPEAVEGELVASELSDAELLEAIQQDWNLAQHYGYDHERALAGRVLELAKRFSEPAPDSPIDATDDLLARLEDMASATESGDDANTLDEAIARLKAKWDGNV